MDKEPLNYDVRGAAEFLGVSVPTLRQDRRTNRHRFPCVVIGNRTLYPTDLLRQWRDAHTVNMPTKTAAAS